VGEGLVASAVAPDGLIEALEVSGDGWAVGVQWHPEMLIDVDAGTRRLFENFVDAARSRAERGRTGVLTGF
jgi:putative glutamine amidotransferase